MSELEILERRFNRERAARKEAESLLEQKSREAFEANQQLRNFAELNRAIVETAAEGIITYDQAGTIQSFNRSAERIFGCSSRNGCNVRELFERSDKTQSVLFPAANARDEQWRERATEDLETSEPAELIAIRSNGRTFATEVATSVISNGDSKLFTALLRDLSGRRKLEARLSQVRKMESVGQLAAGIAHEINTPIQFIGNNIQFLQGAFEDIAELLDMYGKLMDALRKKEDIAAIIQAIERQIELADLPFLREEFPGAIAQTIEGTDRVAKIVRAMKEFSQPASGAKTSVNINRAIENAVAISSNNYRDIATVELELDPSLRPVTCLCAEMNQALLNVLVNAAEAIAGAEASGVGRIVVSTRSAGDDVVVIVKDNGPGIPAEIQGKIFDPFFTTKEVGKGTGQGLAFVYDLVVNKHGGAIYAESPPEGGATFFIRLPLGSGKRQERREHADSID
jgi:PAS domain S-box-containing protein